MCCNGFGNLDYNLLIVKFPFTYYDRLNRFSSRCSIINTEVCHEFVTTDDDIHEDLPTPIEDHTIPIVHLDTNIAVTESLSLLTECTYVDTVLTALPVCSSSFLRQEFIKIL